MKRIVLCISLLLASSIVFGGAFNPRGLDSDLKDCKFYVADKPGRVLDIQFIIARCPNSTTSTTTMGKNSLTVITIDGVEYEKKK
ncbi:MAG: hypothetical protein WC679_02630 [Bacteroidales bacterium]